MAKSLPTLIAFLLSAYGVNMFGSNYVHITSVQNLYASYFIKLGMYFLLLDVNLYQKCFKKLHSLPLFFYEVRHIRNSLDSCHDLFIFLVNNCIILYRYGRALHMAAYRKVYGV